MSELDEQLSVFIAARFFIRITYSKLGLGNKLILGSGSAMIAVLMPWSILLLSPRDRNTGYFLDFCVKYEDSKKNYFKQCVNILK